MLLLLLSWLSLWGIAGTELPGQSPILVCRSLLEVRIVQNAGQKLEDYAVIADVDGRAMISVRNGDHVQAWALDDVFQEASEQILSVGILVENDANPALNRLIRHLSNGHELKRHLVFFNNNFSGYYRISRNHQNAIELSRQTAALMVRRLSKMPANVPDVVAGVKLTESDVLPGLDILRAFAVALLEEGSGRYAIENLAHAWQVNYLRKLEQQGVEVSAGRALVPVAFHKRVQTQLLPQLNQLLESAQYSEALAYLEESEGTESERQLKEGIDSAPVDLSAERLLDHRIQAMQNNYEPLLEEMVLRLKLLLRVKREAERNPRLIPVLASLQNQVETLSQVIRSHSSL